jgi:hypothetical protein
MKNRGCVLVPRWRQRPNAALGVLIIVLMVMAYPVALEWLDFPTALIASATATVSLLASRLIWAVVDRRRGRSTGGAAELPADIW